MKIRVFDKAPEPPEEKEEMFLVLKEHSDRVILKAVDEEGDEIDAGQLLSINSDGTITLFWGINKDLGLRLTETGYLKVK